jgi:hypothetical protein
LAIFRLFYSRYLPGKHITLFIGSSHQRPSELLVSLNVCPSPELFIVFYYCITTEPNLAENNSWKEEIQICSSKVRCDKVFQCVVAGQWFPFEYSVSSTNKNYHNDISEILFKVDFTVYA